MCDAFILDAVRTPRGIGKPDTGALAGMHPQHLSAIVLKALAERNGIVSDEVDDVIWSTSTQRGQQSGDMGRMAALDAGLGTGVSGVTLDRFCGGGLTAVAFAAAQIGSGAENLIVAGGCEMMSYTAQLAAQDRDAGIRPQPVGAGNTRLDALFPQAYPGVCGDAIASLEGFSREQLDAYGLESQRRAGVAIAEGRFERSIVPVVDADGRMRLAVDEHPRPHSTAAQYAELNPAFAKLADQLLDDHGTTFRKQIGRRYPNLDIQPLHHAGTSSGVVDGAGAVLLASSDFVRKRGIKPRGRVVCTANMGDDPTLMLNAPVPAARKVLAKAGLSVDQIDVWEVNEAFAAVAEKFIRDLGLDRDKVNVNGGAIAFGHPIGATGAMLVGMLLDELERSGGRYGLVTMCAAGGMAPAIIIERLAA